MSTGPIRDLATFAGALRDRGLVVTPDQTAAMATSITLVDPASQSQVRAAFKSLTITDPGQQDVFDEIFDHFFGGAITTGQEERIPGQEKPVGGSTPVLESTHQDHGETSETTGASATETVADMDFSHLDPDELAEARRMVALMFWQPTDVRTRRWAADRHGRRPDLRRTLHSAIGPTGDLLQIRYRKRRTRQRPLIVIADISGSMERYAQLFLVFAHAARRRLAQVETFTFSTHLTRITEEMSRRDTATALRLVNDTVTDWSGGTLIGDAIAAWNKKWSRRLARGGPVVLILSDGWDCGDPEVLRSEMARLSRSVHSVIWLNPLAARVGYRPATRGMQAALPHVDHFLPAASVSDLRDVVRLLENINGGPA